MSFSVHFVKRLVGKIFPILRKTQKVNLALGIFGQVKSHSGLMSEIVREIPGATKHKHRLKRFWRFLSNYRVKPDQLRLLWITWCLKTFCRTRVVPVAMDWTTLPGNIQCLMIAIPFHGRAIPLLWHILYYSEIKDSQNLIEERLLTRLNNLVEAVDPSKELLLTADRGFGRASLFQFLLNKNFLFAIRVRGDVTVTLKSGKKMSLRTLGKKLIPDTGQWYQQILYRNDGIVSGLALAAVVAKEEEGKEPDPWFLITNLRKPETTIERYQDRFHIEEWFKDLKHQLGIHELQTRNLMRVRRMIFLACLSYGITMLIGTVANKLKTVKDQLITDGNHTASRIWIALKIIKYQLLGREFWKKVYLRATGP